MVLPKMPRSNAGHSPTPQCQSNNSDSGDVVLSEMQLQQRNDSLNSGAPPPVINLFKGHPSPDLLPNKEVLKASSIVLSDEYTQEFSKDNEDRHPLTYGSDPGSKTVRGLIADWINAPGADWINLTNGASYGVLLALLSCTNPYVGVTKQAFIVSPAYFLINPLFLDAGFSRKLTPIYQNPDGSIDLQKLETLLQFYDSDNPVDSTFSPSWGSSYDATGSGLQSRNGSISGTCTTTTPSDASSRPTSMSPPPHILSTFGAPAKKVYKFVVYLVPTFSNPMGVTMPLATRHALIALARKYDVLLICDDVYDALDFSQDTSSPSELPPRFVTLDRQTMPPGHIGFGNTLSNCSFSKIVGPGLRVGWQESATPLLVKQLSSIGAVRSGGTPAHLNSVIVGALLHTGMIHSIIAKLIDTYRRRSTSLRQALTEYLPQGTTILGGQGGYFMWVTIPNQYDGMEITKECERRGLILAPATHFQVEGFETENKLVLSNSYRVCFAYHDETDLVRAARIWGQVCRLTCRRWV